MAEGSGSRIAVPVMVALVVGVALGFAGARLVLVGSAWSLVPWAAVSLLIGATARSARSACVTAALFGFALATTFMIAGYTGSASLLSRLLPFALLGLVGAGCATILALAAYGAVEAARRLRRRRSAQQESGYRPASRDARAEPAALPDDLTTPAVRPPEAGGRVP